MTFAKEATKWSVFKCDKVMYVENKEKQDSGKFVLSVSKFRKTP